MGWARATWIIAPLLLGIGACDSQTTLTEDSADLRMCVWPANGPVEGGGQTYVAGQPVQIVVGYVGCLSSSCDVDRSASCSVSLVGDTLTVTAELRWTEAGSLCTDDCRRLSASCASVALPAGSYTVVFGSRTATVGIGTSSVAAPCVGP